MGQFSSKSMWSCPEVTSEVFTSCEKTTYHICSSVVFCTIKKKYLGSSNEDPQTQADNTIQWTLNKSLKELRHRILISGDNI